MTIIEIIREAEKKYGESVSVQELNEAAATLEGLPKTRFNEINLKRRNKLIAFLKIKAAVLSFLFNKEEDLSQRNLDAAKLRIDEGKIILEGEASVEDVGWIGSLKDIMTQVAVYFKDVYSGLEGAERGEDGFNANKYCLTLELVNKKLTEMQEGKDFGRPLDLFPLPETSSVNFLFPSLNSALHAKMRNCRNRLNEYFRLNYFTPVSVRGDLARYDKYELCPDDIIGTKDVDSRILFVSTPFENEFTLLLNANAEVGGEKRKIVQLNTGWWNEMCVNHNDKASAEQRAKEVKNIFYGFLTYIEYDKNPTLCALYGVNSLPVWDRRGVLTACSEYAENHKGKPGFVILDTTGDIALLREYNGLDRAEVKTYASNMYLSLPRYRDAYNALKAVGEKRLEELKRNGAFLGYIGLSKLLEQFLNGDELWENEYKRTSDINEATAADFLEELLEDNYLIPADWGWKPKKERKRIDGDVAGYDYDQIKEVMNDEIKRIMENPEPDIYRRCEQLVIYCLGAGEDVTVWGKLDDEEKKARVTTAVKVIATAMRCYYSNPIVEFCDTKEGAWGGRCCGGGHTIQFKVRSIQDLAWTRDAILHELYHSLQHTMISFGCSLAWYKRTYHVSEERRMSWQDNERYYLGVDEDMKRYWIQVQEVDARDFACMCLGDTVYHQSRI